jgi:hypothetical protein
MKPPREERTFLLLRLFAPASCFFPFACVGIWQAAQLCNGRQLHRHQRGLQTHGLFFGRNGEKHGRMEPDVAVVAEYFATPDGGCPSFCRQLRILLGFFLYPLDGEFDARISPSGALHDRHERLHTRVARVARVDGGIEAAYHFGHNVGTEHVVVRIHQLDEEGQRQQPLAFLLVILFLQPRLVFVAPEFARNAVCGRDVRGVSTLEACPYLYK